MLLSSCGSGPRDEKFANADKEKKPEPTSQEVEANRLLNELDAQLESYRLLPPDDRLAKEAQLGKQLERIVAKAEGTKYENKALYYLASWRMNHAGGEGVAQLLDRLAHSEFLPYKNAGRLLRVEVDLRAGKIAEARSLAQSLAADVPEFAQSLKLVDFFEQVGKKAGRTAGRNLTGGPSDPAASSAEPWLLYLFVPQIVGDTEQKVGQYLAELGKPEYSGKIRVVCVSFAANPLDATGAFTSLPGTSARELLWANPNDAAESAEWTDGWRLPGLPACALLGPDRTIMAVQLAPTDLRRLIGKGTGKKPSG